jgi:hypothetical protein
VAITERSKALSLPQAILPLHPNSKSNLKKISASNARSFLRTSKSDVTRLKKELTTRKKMVNEGQVCGTGEDQGKEIIS